MLFKTNVIDWCCKLLVFNNGKSVPLWGWNNFVNFCGVMVTKVLRHHYGPMAVSKNRLPVGEKCSLSNSSKADQI